MKATLAVLAVTVLVPLQGQDTVKKEIARLKGAWRIESLDVGDEKPLPPEALGMIAVKITDDRFIIEASGQKKEALYKIDPTKTPKEIDITPQDGPNKGKAGTGIYTLDGDTLRICHSEKGNARPKAFKVDKTTGTGILTLKRIKP